MSADTGRKPRAIALGDGTLGTAPAGGSVSLGKHFELTANGLVVHGAPPLREWTPVGPKLRVLERGAQLAVGDYANELEDRFGEEASQLLDADSGWSLKTLANYQWVARRVAIDIRRMDRLGVRHHQLVAPLAPTKQKQWLDRAAADEDDHPWTVARLRKALQAGEDVPASDWFILLGPLTSGQVQDELLERFAAEGLACKAVTRRKQKPREAAA